jgi:hypothetical protein
MTPNPKPRNGVGGWILLIAIVLGGNAGSSYLRPQPPHNPDITTEAWIKMTVTVDRLEREMTELSRDVRDVLRRLPQQSPPQRP